MVTRGFTGSIDVPFSSNTRQLLADILLAFVAFVPHCAGKGLGQVMGGRSLRMRPLTRQESP